MLTKIKIYIFIADMEMELIIEIGKIYKKLNLELLLWGVQDVNLKIRVYIKVLVLL